MSSDPAAELLARVHRAARTPRAAPVVPDGCADDAPWRVVEAALERELQTSPRRARALVAAFARVADAADVDSARGRAARLRASWLAYTGRFEESLEAYDEAIARLRGPARDGARVGKAGALLRLGRFDEARSVCQAARRAARRRGDVVLAGAARLNEAVALHESGSAARAVPLYREAAAELAQGGHAGLAATAEQNLANALVLLDRWDEALPHVTRAADAFAGLGLRHEAARCALNRGALLSAADRLGDADDVLRAAEIELDAAGDAAQTALCRLDRGEVLLRAGLVPEAVHTLRRAQAGLRRGVPPAERVRGRLLLARALLRADDTSAARRLLRPQGTPTRAQDAERLELLGHAAAQAGRWTEAADAFRAAARAFARRRPDHGARTAAAEARCRLAAGDVAAARRRADAALRTAVSARVRFAAHAVRFLVAADHDAPETAEQHLDRACAELERIRDGLGPDAFRAALLEGRDAWFARAVRFLLDRDASGARALALIEQFRARALLDLAASSGHVTATASDLDALRLRVAALERRADGTATGPLLRDAALREGPEVRAALHAAEAELRQVVERARPPGARDAFDLAAFRRSLPADTRALCVHSDDAGTCLFVVSRSDLRIVRTPLTHDAVERLVGTLRFRLGRFTAGAAFVTRHRERLARDTQRALDDLADAVLVPAAEALDGARDLVVVPSGAWHHVPFAALPWRGAPLIAAMTVRLAPALAALAANPSPARGAPVVCGFADANAPTIDAEVAQIGQVLPRAVTLADESATLEHLRAHRRPSCLHIAAHGRHRADAPAMSGLQLHDGWLRAADLSLLDLRGSLVVLSGCETGVSTVRAADELHGLVRGVFAAGAGELVASLWRVDDTATTELMTRFHGARSAGLSAPAALARAQTELAAAGRHPWYWAGFGLWSRRLRA